MIFSSLIIQKLPFYIFCESYGGKMAAAFALALTQVSTYIHGVRGNHVWIPSSF